VFGTAHSPWLRKTARWFVLLQAPVGPLAHADPGEFGEPGALARARAEDPGVDHGILSSHAETLRHGEIGVNLYEVVFVGFSGGLSDDLQLSLTMLPPLGTPPFLVALQGKYALYRDEKTTLSARLSSLNITDWQSDSSAGGGVYLFGPGLLVDRAVDRGGRLTVHGGLSCHAALSADYATSDDPDEGSDWAGLILVEAGLTLRPTAWVQVMAETLLPLPLATAKASNAPRFALVDYGLRVHNEAFGVDLAMMRPVGEVDMRGWFLGIPFVGLSGRL